MRKEDERVGKGGSWSLDLAWFCSLGLYHPDGPGKLKYIRGGLD